MPWCDPQHESWSRCQLVLSRSTNYTVTSRWNTIEIQWDETLSVVPGPGGQWALFTYWGLIRCTWWPGGWGGWLVCAERRSIHDSQRMKSWGAPGFSSSTTSQGWHLWFCKFNNYWMDAITSVAFVSFLVKIDFDCLGHPTSFQNKKLKLFLWF